MRNDRFWKSDLRTFSRAPPPPPPPQKKKKIASHFIGVSRASFNLARGVSIYLVGFGQWEFRNFFLFFSRHFLDILRWLVLVFSRGESLHFWTHEIQKTNMAARGFFCASFNTFLWRYFWPVLYKIRIYLKEIKNAQCALLSYISTWEFIFSHFSSVLKNSQVLI